MRFSKHRCPICREPFDDRTPTRAVRVWRNLVKDDRIDVVVAACAKCGTDYELTSFRKIHRFRGSPYILLLALVTLLASLMDGFLSLQLVGIGAREANPLLDFCLTLGPLTFLLVKYGLTSLGVVLLVLFHDVDLLAGRLKGRHVLVGAQLMFAITTIYQVILLRAGIASAFLATVRSAGNIG